MVGMAQKSWRLVLALSLLLTVFGTALARADRVSADDGDNISLMGSTQTPSLGISPDGSKICAVWSLFGDNPQAFARIYTAGAGWGPVKQLSDGSFTRVQFPHCTFDATANVHAAWEEGSSTLNVVHRMLPANADQQTGWSNPDVIESNADQSDIDANQMVANQSAGGQVWAVYRKGNGAGGYNVYAKTWTASGWSGAETVGGGS
jgi:hypothetical protein